MIADQPALEVRQIARSFVGVQAVDGVSMRVETGECHGLVGENGAGKSTLIKVISGVIAPDHGEVQICGKPTAGSVQDALNAGLATLHQEITLVPQFDAAENIALGLPPRTRARMVVDWAAVRAQARSALDRLGVDVPLGVPVSQMSPAMQTMVTLARALAQDARILVLDEPTAALTDQEIAQLFGVLRKLRTQGVAVLYVSHRLEEIFELCDRITVMRDGKVVAESDASDLDVDQLIGLMAGRDTDQVFPDRAATPGNVVLAAEHLSGTRVNDLTVDVRAGEVLGVAGLAGSGRTELLRLLSGAQSPLAGALSMGGKSVRFGSPRAALRAGVALVPEERRSQGLVLTQSVGENLVASVLHQIAGVAGTIRRAREHSLAQGLARTLQIRAVNLAQNVGELSGGNQQKVVLGRVLARQPQVLLLDEPTRGIDAGTKPEIYRFVRNLAADGCGVVVVSSELPELLGLADRLAVLREGRLVQELPAATATQQEVLSYCYGKAE